MPPSWRAGSGARSNDMGDYWLGRVLDEQGIKTARDLKKALASAAIRDRVAEAAEEACSVRPPKPVAHEASAVVAARQFDLSGISTCPGAKCLQRQLDEGLPPVW